MEDEKDDLALLGVSEELKADIAKKTKELKAKEPNVRIFPLIVKGRTALEEKEFYVAYFREPGFVAFSKYLTVSQSNSMPVAMRSLANDCYLGGDKELIDNDSLFLFGLMGQLSKIIDMRNGALVNL